MRALASLVMRGRFEAVMLATVLAMLSLLLPPSSILSSAAVALVTLRNGPGYGFTVVIISGLTCAGLAYVTWGAATPVIGFSLLMWLSIWFAATLLRYSRSLAITMQGVLFLGLLVIVAQYLQGQDPVAQWRSLLEPFTQSLVEAQMVEESRRQELAEVMARWVPGAVAAGFILQVMASLFMARWWQAMLYNPGGFKAEFHQLRMPRILAIITLLVLLFQTGVADLGAFADYVAMLLLAAWFLQGLSLAHGVLGKLGANSGWLVGIYFLLVFAMPHAVTALAAAGFADAWFDFRVRLQDKNGPGETS
ncbi:DUF2232 domain-containing protein [Solemya velesiana gill symbiont]|uniref:DUF2232 domain-containing protein n=1 Tax=Solemya velesiana gill symbiont TaxID=1918948 RepID=A0A1T2KPF6_9GAMM|nr:DUF2232 domain-containing protein [Solemya velesiana gill symbiont]OOZ34768.1 hypothetical protein BOW51_11810 [Solemya velesiana gill symbiont]